MLQGIYKILLNKNIAPDIFKMVLSGDTTPITASGQFINIKIDGTFLRRPISVCDYDEKTITVIYKVVGVGTKKMSFMKENDELDILVSLGNGYNTEKCIEKPLLIGGGVGIPPLYNLCKKLLSKGKKPTVILGFNNKNEIFLRKEFEALGVKVLVTTVDGTEGIKGFVTDAMDKIEYDYFFTCGPMSMFKAIEKKVKTSGQFSFEEKMGCGFGACMGCSCKTKYGNKRICKDGPVLEREEIIW